MVFVEINNALFADSFESQLLNLDDTSIILIMTSTRFNTALI